MSKRTFYLENHFKHGKDEISRNISIVLTHVSLVQIRRRRSGFTQFTYIIFYQKHDTNTPDPPYMINVLVQYIRMVYSTRKIWIDY